MVAVREEQMSDLIPIAPREAVELYIDDIQAGKSSATVRSHESRLSHFTQWCEDPDLGDIENMNNVTGRHTHRFKLWRRNEGGINRVTEKTQIDTLRVFLRFAASIDAVPEDLPPKVLSPTLGDTEGAKDEMLDGDVVKGILDHLAKYRYASPQHVAVVLLWRCLLRRGAVRGLDVKDFDPDELSLRIAHRPETDTPLKNQGAGERYVALRESTAALLDDYLASGDRWAKSDEHGRQPLLTTRYGRPHVTTIQSYVYGATRPCLVTNECPHDREIDECDAAAQRMHASQCPSTIGPHSLRRSAITYWLNNDVPKNAIVERANVQQMTLDRHYDERSERRKMEQRRKFLHRFE